MSPVDFKERVKGPNRLSASTKVHGVDNCVGWGGGGVTLL